ncbi:MAG: hypothetical protein ACYTXY_47535, partial [Nostoc sp.]
MAQYDIRTEQMKTVISEENRNLIQREVQQLESVDIKSTEAMPTAVNYAALESSNFDTHPLPLPSDKPLPQGQQIGGKFSAFLEQLPKNLGRFSTEYQLPIICFA